MRRCYMPALLRYAIFFDAAEARFDARMFITTPYHAAAVFRAIDYAYADAAAIFAVTLFCRARHRLMLFR